MASQGPNNPATFAQDGPGTSWTNPSNVQASDNVYATINLDILVVCRMLQATNYGFSIPTGSTINGIVLTIEKKAAEVDKVSDLHVYLIKGGVTQTAEDKADIENWGVTDASTNYGGASDVWSNTWTAEEINDSGFGAAIRAQQQVDETPVTASIDWMGITVYYTEGDPLQLPRLQRSYSRLQRGITSRLHKQP